MSPNIRKIDNDNPDLAIIKEAADIINSDGVVVAPTETRYGLLARADKAAAVARIYNIKDRKKTSPLSIFVRNARQIGDLAEENEISRKLTGKLLPGPLTLILKAHQGIMPAVVNDLRLGIRYSSSRVIAALMMHVESCLTATSANISGEMEIDTVQEIAGVFGDRVDLYLDAGKLDRTSSTVVDCANDGYKILRVGSITEDEIQKAIMEN